MCIDVLVLSRKWSTWKRQESLHNVATCDMRRSTPHRPHSCHIVSCKMTCHVAQHRNMSCIGFVTAFPTTGVSEQLIQRRPPLGRQAFRAPNQGVESSFWLDRMATARVKGMFFHRHWHVSLFIWGFD